MHQIKIPGQSGCNLEIFSVEGKTIITKYTKDFTYVKRLEKQKTKQQLFWGSQYENILVPEVFYDYKTSERYGFNMQYFYGLDFVEKLQISSKKQIDNIFNQLVCFIQTNLKTSQIVSISSYILKRKLQDIDGIYDSNWAELVQIPDVVAIPIGPCHGDLTFSNILFHKNKLVFVDFLDSYIETPFFDIIKLRQDTKYKWSTLVYPKSFDQIKTEIILDYLDVKIHNEFKGCEWYNRYYTLFQTINLIRILPYVRRNQNITCKLHENIYNLINNED